MLQLLEFRGLHLVRYLLGIEHPLHGCIEELDGHISGKHSPDEVPGKFIDPLLIPFLFCLRIVYRVNLNQYGKYFRPPASRYLGAVPNDG